MEPSPPSPPSAPTSSCSSSSSSWNYSALRASLQKYGRTGVIVYLSLSTCVTAGFYVAIESHVDVRSLLGLKPAEHAQPGWFERVFAGKGSSLALAFLCSKAMVPIKLPVAAAITPYVHRVTQNLFRGGAAKGS